MRNRSLTLVLAALAAAPLAFASPSAAQAVSQPASGPPPTLEEVRKGMGIPSSASRRGQLDTVGFASTAAQMKAVFDLSATPPPPDALGAAPPPGVLGVVCPHDDYLYAGRVYRQVLPLVTAKTVVVVGVFHRYRKFGAEGVLVFDPYETWRAPDGPVAVSPLRGEILAKLSKGDAVVDAAMHDSEHSVEALVFWLKHLRPDVEIVPILVPAATWPRLTELADHLGAALAGAMRSRGLALGKDVAIVVSADAVHYGPDFSQVPFGDGGVDAYVKAVSRDKGLLGGLRGPLADGALQSFYSACVNPEKPTEYRITWCGRFSIPLGLLVLSRTARALGLPAPEGRPLAYATSVGWPELPVRPAGLGETAPANLYHFVGYPAAAWVAGVSAPPR